MDAGNMHKNLKITLASSPEPSGTSCSQKHHASSKTLLFQFLIGVPANICQQGQWT